MQVGVKLSTSLAAVALAGTALAAGPVAGAVEPQPDPRQGQSAPAPEPEEGQGPGAIVVQGEAAERAEERLYDFQARARWCHGTVVVQALNIRAKPDTSARILGSLHRGQRVTVNWDTLTRNDGYDWVRLSSSPERWIADYKLGNGNGKWYVRYSDCR